MVHDVSLHLDLCRRSLHRPHLDWPWQGSFCLHSARCSRANYLLQIGDDITPVQQAQSHLATLREQQRQSQEKTDSEMHKRMAAEERAIAESREKKKKAEEEGEDAPSDPAKKAAGNEPGKQGIYKDDEQTKEGSGPSNPGVGQAPEPSGEKKGLQNPKPERPQPASSRGKA